MTPQHQADMEVLREVQRLCLATIQKRYDDFLRARAKGQWLREPRMTVRQVREQLLLFAESDPSLVLPAAYLASARERQIKQVRSALMTLVHLGELTTRKEPATAEQPVQRTYGLVDPTPMLSEADADLLLNHMSNLRSQARVTLHLSTEPASPDVRALHRDFAKDHQRDANALLRALRALKVAALPEPLDLPFDRTVKTPASE